MSSTEITKALATIHDSIVRTMHMISKDIDTIPPKKKLIDRVVNYVLWFEDKYKRKFRDRTNKLVVKKGEIYYCDFGINIGSEQDKRRPAIILQNDVGNLHSPTTIVAPITDEIKASLPTHVDVTELKADCKANGIVLIEQLRCVSKNRLSNYMDCVDTKSNSWKKVIKAIKIELDVSYNIKKN